MIQRPISTDSSTDSTRPSRPRPPASATRRQAVLVIVLSCCTCCRAAVMLLKKRPLASLWTTGFHSAALMGGNDPVGLAAIASRAAPDPPGRRAAHSGSSGR